MKMFARACHHTCSRSWCLECPLCWEKLSGKRLHDNDATCDSSVIACVGSRKAVISAHFLLVKSPITMRKVLLGTTHVHSYFQHLCVLTEQNPAARSHYICEKDVACQLCMKSRFWCRLFFYSKGLVSLLHCSQSLLDVLERHDSYAVAVGGQCRRRDCVDRIATSNNPAVRHTSLCKLTAFVTLMRISVEGIDGLSSDIVVSRLVISRKMS